MSIEKLLGDLVDAVNGLTAAIAASSGGMATPAATEVAETDPPRRGRGRPKTTDTPVADAVEPQSSDDTTSAAPASTRAAGEDAPAPAVIDAGTGKPIEPVSRDKTKKRGIALIQALGEESTMLALIQKHSGQTGAVTFASVPDAAIPALHADIEAAFPAEGVMD